MFDLSQALKDQIARSPYARMSKRELSEHCGNLPKWLSNVLLRDWGASRDGPALFPFVRFARTIGFSLDRFFGIRADVTLPGPPIQDVVGVWQRYGGRLEALKVWEDFFDIIRPPNQPEGGRIEAVHIGALSLSSRIMGKPCLGTYHAMIDSSPVADELHRKHSQVYFEAAQAGMLFSTDRIDAPCDQEPYRVNIEYCRLLLAVRSTEGERLLVNYCVESPHVLID